MLWFEERGADLPVQSHGRSLAVDVAFLLQDTLDQLCIMKEMCLAEELDVATESIGEVRKKMGELENKLLSKWEEMRAEERAKNAVFLARLLE